MYSSVYVGWNWLKLARNGWNQMAKFRDRHKQCTMSRHHCHSVHRTIANAKCFAQSASKPDHVRWVKQIEFRIAYRVFLFASGKNATKMLFVPWVCVFFLHRTINLTRRLDVCVRVCNCIVIRKSFSSQEKNKFTTRKMSHAMFTIVVRSFNWKKGTQSVHS